VHARGGRVWERIYANCNVTQLLMAGNRSSLKSRQQNHPLNYSRYCEVMTNFECSIFVCMTPHTTPET
jgi:hypothetical protein